MIVKFDFRPESLINPPVPRTRKLFMLMFSLLLTFLGVAGYASFVAGKDYVSLQNSVTALTTRVAHFDAVKAGLVAEIERLQKREALYVSSLNIMNQELPSIEILHAIDRSLPEGVSLSGLTIKADNVNLSGASGSEENIVRTTRNLLGSGAFSMAQVPVANRTGNNRDGIRFNLTLSPLLLSEVKR